MSGERGRRDRSMFAEWARRYAEEGSQASPLIPAATVVVLRDGADGVFIGGCHPGDCHYHEGNYKCLRRFHLLEKYLEQMGICKERIRLEWISASEGKQFAELADSFTNTVRELGPCTIKQAIETYT